MNLKLKQIKTAAATTVKRKKDSPGNAFNIDDECVFSPSPLSTYECSLHCCGIFC